MDLDKLHQQIIDRPSDHDARQVFADALLERQDPRGEFVRFQLELDRMDDEDPRRARLEKITRQLEDDHGQRWFHAVREVGTFGHSSKVPPRYSSRRGFVEHMNVTETELLDHGDSLMEVTPLTSARLTELTPRGVKMLAAWPRLCQLTELDVRFKLFADDAGAALCALIDSPHLGPLKKLRVEGEFGAEAAMALAACDRASTLETLELSCKHTHGDDRPHIGEKGALALASSPHLGRLSRLWLHENGIGHRGLSALLDSKTLGKLTDLSLSSEKLGARGIKALAGAERLESLRALALRDCGLAAGGLAAVAKSPHLRGLEHLDLSGANRINAKSLPALLDDLAMPGLRSLSLERGSLKAAGAELLAGTDLLSGLTELDLSGNTIRDDGAAALAGARRLPLLQTLYLGGNAIDAAGMGALADGPLLEPVRELWLGNNKFKNAGALALAPSPHLAGMEVLSFHYNWMGVKGLKAILESPHLGSLRQLLISGENNFGVEALRSLARSEAITSLQVLENRESNDKAMKMFCAAPHLSSLRRLRLHGGYTDAGIRSLLDSPHLEGLAHLDLVFPHISNPEMTRLRRRFGERLVLFGPDDNDPCRALPGPCVSSSGDR